MPYNKQLSRILKEMASIYQYMGASQRFRALAYGKAAYVIGSLQEDISTHVKDDTINEIPGIGESIASKIKEYIRTGTIRKYESLKKRVPSALLELMDLTGFGPKTIKRLHSSLHIDNREQLIAALENGRIGKLKGFGEKKVQNMLRSLKIHHVVEERMLLWDALQLAERVLKDIKTIAGVKQAAVAGSIRRKKETIGDIDILVSAAQGEWKRIVAKFVGLPFISEVLAKGETKVSVMVADYNRQVDIRIVHPEEWGAALLYFTGSKEHNVKLRTIARDKGYKISEYGVFDASTNDFIAGRTEEEIYKLLGFQWIPPEMRENKGEFELALGKAIPDLVTVEDIKGDLQMHTKWSDGTMEIEDLASYVLKNFQYDYIVLTDHSPSVRVARGMDENQFMEQIKEIHSVNKRLGREFIKTGAEVDILQDGTLDLNDDILGQLDWVCASIHSGMIHDNTERLIAACEHPFVCCIGHPSGRIIGHRDGYPVNWAKVFDAAKRTGTAFEINCQKDRLDLNDTLVAMARKAGVPLVISTDSHLKEHFAFIELGIAVARRAWCTSHDILNTRGWTQLQQFARAKRKKMMKYA